MKTYDFDPRMQDFDRAEWASFLNPVALLWLYYILGIESYFLLQPRVSIQRFYWFNAERVTEIKHTQLQVGLVWNYC